MSRILYSSKWISDAQARFVSEIHPEWMVHPQETSQEVRSRVSDVHPPELNQNISKVSWRKLLKWPLSRLKNFKTSGGGGRRDAMVELTDANLLSLIFHWGLDSNFRLGGPIAPKQHVQDDLALLGLRFVKILKHQGRQACLLTMKATCFFIDRWLADQDAPRNP